MAIKHQRELTKKIVSDYETILRVLIEEISYYDQKRGSFYHDEAHRLIKDTEKVGLR